MTAGRKNTDTLSVDWGTPKHYVEAVKEVFGGRISLDPCSNRWSIVKADIKWSLPHIYGLQEPWDFKTIYVNPPYGSDKIRGTRIADWLAKCAEAHAKNKSQVIALVPVAANTGHWKSSVWSQAESICFLYDTRLRFLENGQDVGKGAPMACAMIYWGDDEAKFANVFSRYGAVLSLQGIKLPANTKAARVKYGARKMGRLPSFFDSLENV